MDTLRYSHFTAQQLEHEFRTSLTLGLSTSQAANLKKSVSSLSLSSSRLVWPFLLIRQFRSPFLYLLVGCALISFFLESRINAGIILIIILLNGLITFFQEYRASRSLQLLQEHLELLCTVLRDGVPYTISQKHLVPGDLLILDVGNYVPADVRIIQGKVLIDESTLSGESLPVEKDTVVPEQPAQTIYEENNMAFLGTIIVAGSARAIVVSIGKQTYFGEISMHTLATPEESGFQERLALLSRFLLMVIVSTLILLFLVHLILKGSQVNILELSLFSLALVIGLTPEALPTVTMFALSKGAVLLARKHVIVKRLSAVEDLGSISLLCTDKTGTLTENTLAVTSWFKESPELKLFSYLVSLRPTSDSFDRASMAIESPEDHRESLLFTRLEERPFDPSKRSTAVLVKKGARTILIVRGALDDIFKACTHINKNKERDEWLLEQANQGNRVLAIAYKEQAASIEDATALTLAGLVAFHDPIKPTAEIAIKKARNVGIVVKMLTGDSKEVACYIAKTVGLIQEGDCAVSGDEFETLTPTEKKATLKKYHVFARFLPSQKLELVKLFREECTVGFLGDGINDAPALQAAHVGLVVQNASDIAKEAADIILLKKSLLTIIEGIALGRAVFINTLKYIITSISSNFGNFYSIAIASLFIDFLPLLPRQLLLINIISDFPMIAIATDTVDQQELLKPPNYNIKGIALLSLLLALISSIFDFTFFAFFYHAQPIVLQTLWFMESVLTELVLIFSVRTRFLFFRARRPSLILLFLAVTAALVTGLLPLLSWGQLLFHFTRPTMRETLIVGSIVLTYFIATDMCKSAYYAFLNHDKNGADKRVSKKVT